MNAIAAIERPDRAAVIVRSLATFVPLAIFLALLVWLGIAAPTFLKPATIAVILSQAVPTAVVSLGLATVIMAGGDDVISGGIDLSIPAIAVLAAAIVADLVTNKGVPIFLALALAMGVAIIAGLVNAALVVAVGMTPLLATLASGTAYVGISNVVTSSRRINVDDPFIVALRDGTVLGMPAGVVAAFVLIMIFYFVVHRTRWGLNMQAVGGNRDAAEISGLSPGKFIAQSFLLAGVAGGFASAFVLARGSGIAPGVDENLMMEMVLATFLGAAFSPRRVVTLWGAVLGAVLVAALSVGFGSVGIDIFWTGCIKGGLILIVVASSALARSSNQ